MPLVENPQSDQERRQVLSYSRLGVVADCGEKYRLRYIEKIRGPRGVRMLIGSAVHAGVEFNLRHMAANDLTLGCTCTIHRKDRKHPVIVTEWLIECQRDTEPWKQHPRRMIRHKAIAQCARIAFGFAFQDAEELAEDTEYEVVTPKALAGPNVVDLKVGPDSIQELKDKNNVEPAQEVKVTEPQGAAPANGIHPVARANQRAQIDRWEDEKRETLRSIAMELQGGDVIKASNLIEAWMTQMTFPASMTIENCSGKRLAKLLDRALTERDRIAA